MSISAAPPPSAVLDAFEDIINITDIERRILYVNSGPWKAFAHANGGEAIEAPESVLGRPLDEFLDGDSIREQFRTLFEQVRDGARQTITYPFRCDAPGAIRYMRLTMSAIRNSAGEVDAVLFQSTLLDEKEREAQAIMDAHSRVPGSSAPVQPICAYCKRLQFPAGSDEWLEAEEYTARGGSATVRLSHGICPDCAAVLLARSNAA